jgi:4-hydroxy-tetrahydrodipicolinate synthase
VDVVTPNADILSARAAPSRVENVRGVCPVLATPFARDGELDLEGFDRVVDHVLGTGVTSVLLFGLAGEAYKLDDAERDTLLESLLRRTRGREDVTAVVSITDHATEVAVRRAHRWLAAGADALNVLPPSFLKPAPEQVLAHLAAILEAAAAPVVFQYAPNETGGSIEAGALVDLSRTYGNLRIVKVEAQPPGDMVAELLRRSNGALVSLVGYAGLTWPEAVRAGAVGVQPGCSFTEVYVAAQQKLDSGDEAGFVRLHARMLPYLERWMQSVEHLVAVEKAILWRRGLIETPYCRRPAHALVADESRLVDAFLSDFSAELA